MSVQSDISRIQYSGNASAVTPYPVPFPFHEATHIRVVVTDEAGAEVELIRGTEYAVAGAGAQHGGNVTTKAPVASTKKLTIYREVPEVQGTTWKENDRFPAEAMERGLDKLTMICQQLARKVSRALRFSDASPEVIPWEARKREETGVMLLDSTGELQLWSLKRLKEELMIQAAIDPMLQAMMVQHPVGSLFFTIDSRNPRDILGFGTWVRYGNGRMIVAVDPSNPDFNQAGKTGGAATHTLTAAQIPGHAHVLAAHNAMETSAGGAHSHNIKVPSYTTPSGGAHKHAGYGVETANRPVSYIIDDDRGTSSRQPETAADGQHTHTIDIPAFNTVAGGAHVHTFDVPEQTTQSTGGGAAHNNMPPYISVHVWIRINSDAPDQIGSLPFPADPTLYVDRVTGETRRIVIDNTVIGNISVP